jgi:hypothetical protein
MGEPVVQGEKIHRPDKAELAAAVADLCKLPSPKVSVGASVESPFIDAVHGALFDGPAKGSDVYRKTATLLDRLGLTYDPYWDTSEAAPAGGGTVTTRAYSRILSALRGVPRCFILNVTDAAVGTRWERNHAEVYRYDDTVTGRRSLNDAGPGSRVVYYSTSNASTNPKHFIATAMVGYISPGWSGPWEARLENYCELAAPVPVEEFEMAGWNHQHAITEISFGTYEALMAAGGMGPRGPGPVGVEPDPGGVDVAARILEDFPDGGDPPTITVPTELPTSVGPVDPPSVPHYAEQTDGSLTPAAGLGLPISKNPRRDKLAELRAIGLVAKAFEGAEWLLSADRQADGVGYDLEFTKGSRELRIEVKGIQGSSLTFNLTPKEFWRATTDEKWALVAVTSVLSPSDYNLQFVTRDRIVAGQRVITGYRLALDTSGPE